VEKLQYDFSPAVVKLWADGFYRFPLDVPEVARLVYQASLVVKSKTSGTTNNITH
jgi:hypothetical protein